MASTRPGRRRGTAWIAGIAVLAVLGGAGVVLWEVLRTDESDSAAAGEVPDQTDAARGPGQMTVDITPTSGYIATLRVADATRQALTVQNLTGGPGGTSVYAGEVSAYEPGTFDPAALKQGQPSVVAGHDGWYVPEYVFPGDGRAQRTATLGWQDSATGLWVLVYADTTANEGRVLDLEHLQRLAETVLISPPHDLRAPFRVSWVPDGMTLTYLAASDNVGQAGSATIGLSTPDRRPSAAASYAGVPGNLRLSVSATAPGRTWPSERSRLADYGRTVGGKKGWLLGQDLVFEAGRCVVRVHNDAALSQGDLDKFVKQLLIGDCSQNDSWTPPVG